MPAGPSDSAALYRHSAEFFDVRYAQKDYAAEARAFLAALKSVHPNAVTLLDVACGTARHLEHLVERFQAEGVDLNDALLAAAQGRLPSVRFHRQDMTTFDLGRSFDIVTCFFASLPYVATVTRMEAAVARMAHHLSPDGVLFIEPGLTPSAYWEDEVVHNFRRTDERAISWMYVMRREENRAVWDIHWLVGSSQEGVSSFVEREEFGLFTTEECVDAMRSVGLDVFHHPRGLHGYGAFFARRRPWTPGETSAIAETLAG